MSNLNIKIAWLYYDLLELYGDRGNINVLTKILQDNGVDYEVDKVTIRDDIDISDHDIIFLGGGSDRAQQLIAPDLFSRKEQIKSAMDKNGFILGICGGYQMFGQYYLDAHGYKAQGLGLFDFYTVAGEHRKVGNIKVKTGEDSIFGGIEIVGFENHGGETKNVGENSFAEVLKGNGNEYQSEYEGFLTNNFLGTYIHGPLFPKNPLVAKSILESVLTKKYGEKLDLKLTYLPEAEKAQEVVRFD